MYKGTKFGDLHKMMDSLGFRTIRQGRRVIFLHSSGRPAILLPGYKSRDQVAPIHLTMIRKQLVDAGLLEPDEFSVRMQEA